jgi:hypothetical protein
MPQGGDDPDQRVARLRGLADDFECPAGARIRLRGAFGWLGLQRRQLGVRLGDDEGREAGSRDRGEWIGDQRSTGQKGGRLAATEPAAAATGEDGTDRRRAPATGE